MSDDKIPIIDMHRGVGVHDSQPPERISRVVKPEIDLVLDRLTDIQELYRIRGGRDTLARVAAARGGQNRG